MTEKGSPREAGSTKRWKEGCLGKQLLGLVRGLLCSSPAVNLALKSMHRTEQRGRPLPATQTRPRCGPELTALTPGLLLALRPGAACNLWPEPNWVNCRLEQKKKSMFLLGFKQDLEPCNTWNIQIQSESSWHNEEPE